MVTERLSWAQPFLWSPPIIVFVQSLSLIIHDLLHLWSSLFLDSSTFDFFDPSSLRISQSPIISSSFPIIHRWSLPVLSNKMEKWKCNSKYRSSTLELQSPIHRESSPASDPRRKALWSSNRAVNLPNLDIPAVIRSSKPFEVSKSPDNIHSPYHLHRSNHSGSVLASEALDGTNYSIWTIAMTTSLEVKNKLGFIDWFIVMSTENDPFHKFSYRCSSTVKSWLLNNVSKQIYTSIMYFKAASDMWKDLHTRFHNSNLSRL